MSRFQSKPKRDRCIVHPCPHDLDMNDLLKARPLVLDRDLLDNYRRQIIRDTGSRRDPGIQEARRAGEVRAL